MMSRPDFILSTILIFSCIYAQASANPSASRHDEGNPAELVLPSSTVITTVRQSISSATPQDGPFSSSPTDGGSRKDEGSFKPSLEFARILSDNHYNDAPKLRLKLNSTVAASSAAPQFTFPGRKLEVEDPKNIQLQPPTVIRLVDGTVSPEPTVAKAPSTTSKVIFTDDPTNVNTAPGATKAARGVYYGDASHAYVQHQTSHTNRESEVHKAPESHFSQHGPPQHVHSHSHHDHGQGQLHSGQSHPHHEHGQGQIHSGQGHHGHAQVGHIQIGQNHHSHGHNSIPYLPEVYNEVSGSPYPAPKEVEHHFHQDDYFTKNPAVVLPGKHVEGHVSVGVPAVYQSHTTHGHSSTEVHGGHHGRDSYITPALSRALKFWIPSALLLTGVSALFPKRVHVPTNEQDEVNNRPKRSPQYDIETDLVRIPAQLLRREHRGDDSGLEVYDYEDNTSSPYYQHPEPLRITQSRELYPQFHGTLPEAEIQAFRQSPTIPPFVPMPMASADYQTEKPKIPTKSSSLVQKSTSNPTTASKVVVNSKPAAESKLGINGSITDGRRVIVIVRTRPTTATVGATLPTVQSTSTTTHGSTVPTVKSSLAPIALEMVSKTETKTVPPTSFGTRNPGIPTIKAAPLISPQATTTMANATSNIESPVSLSVPIPSQTIPKATGNVQRAPKAQFSSDPILQELLKESRQNSVAVKELLKDIPDQKPAKPYDLSPDGPVMGLLSSVVEHDNESEACQKRALCELAIRGADPKATKFETFMWSLSTLVPDAFTHLYDLEDVFKAIRAKKCATFACQKPNLDIQGEW